MLGQLFLRALPGEFTNNSTYAWFPLMTPTAMDEILTELQQDVDGLCSMITKMRPWCLGVPSQTSLSDSPTF